MTPKPQRQSSYHYFDNTPFKFPKHLNYLTTLPVPHSHRAIRATNPQIPTIQRTLSQYDAHDLVIA